MMGTALSSTLSRADIAPIDSFQGYVNHISQFEVLSADKERELFNRFQRSNDLDAARQLVFAHLRYVVSIAKSYSGYGLPVEDLVQEGNVGLMKSVKRFDLGFGVRLVSFATHWIKSEILEYILRNYRPVKIATTKSQRKLFYRLRQSKTTDHHLSQREASYIAETLKVSVKDVFEMEMRLKKRDVFFDPSYDNAGDEEDSLQAKTAHLADDSPGPEQLLEIQRQKDYESEQIARGLAALNDRARDIIQSRWLSEDKQTLSVLAKRYNVSTERIRQIETNALKEIRKQFLAP